MFIKKEPLNKQWEIYYEVVIEMKKKWKKNITNNFFEQITKKKYLILKSNIEIDDYDDS